MKALVPQCWEINSCTMNADRWAKGLLHWWINPWTDGISPAPVVYGHPICDTLPVHKHSFAFEWQCSITETNDMSIFTTDLSMCTIMAMEMGNIELMVKLQVFTYIHDQHVWFTNSSQQLHNCLAHEVRRLVSLAGLYKPSLAGSRSLSPSPVLRVCSQHTR